MDFKLSYVKSNSMTWPKSPLPERGASAISQIALFTQAGPFNPKLLTDNVNFHISMLQIIGIKIVLLVEEGFNVLINSFPFLIGYLIFKEILVNIMSVVHRATETCVQIGQIVGRWYCGVNLKIEPKVGVGLVDHC